SSSIFIRPEPGARFDNALPERGTSRAPRSNKRHRYSRMATPGRTRCGPGRPAPRFSFKRRLHGGTVSRCRERGCVVLQLQTCDDEQSVSWYSSDAMVSSVANGYLAHCHAKYAQGARDSYYFGHRFLLHLSKRFSRRT